MGLTFQTLSSCLHEGPPSPLPPSLPPSPPGLLHSGGGCHGPGLPVNIPPTLRPPSIPPLPPPTPPAPRPPGLLHNAEVAVGVMGLAFQISAVAYMSAMSLSAAVNVRVANELGSGEWGLRICSLMAFFSF